MDFSKLTNEEIEELLEELKAERSQRKKFKYEENKAEKYTNIISEKVDFYKRRNEYLFDNECSDLDFEKTEYVKRYSKIKNESEN